MCCVNIHMDLKFVISMHKFPNEVELLYLIELYVTLYLYVLELKEVPQSYAHWNTENSRYWVFKIIDSECPNVFFLYSIVNYLKPRISHGDPKLKYNFSLQAHFPPMKVVWYIHTT